MSEQRADTTYPQFELRHRLHRALEVASLKPEEMASVLGRSVTTIRNYLSGRTIPDRGTVIAWALRCGVDFDWLFEGVIPPESPPTQGNRDRACYGEVVSLARVKSRANAA